MARKPKPSGNRRPKDATEGAAYWVSIDLLKPNLRNSRTHSPEQIAAIGESLERFGWVRPALIDEDNTIVAGHGTILGAKSKGFEEAKVVKVSGMSPANLRAYVIADNQLALNSGWNEELLRTELSELEQSGISAEFVGFSDEQIDALFSSADEPKGPRTSRSPNKHQCPACGHKWSGPASQKPDPA